MVALLLTLALPAAGQTPNPTQVQFDPSPDHGTVTRYEIGYFLTDTGTTAFFTADLNKPPCSPQCLAPLPPKPSFGPFWARVRAWGPTAGGGEIASEWSEISNPFALLPLSPTSVLVSK